MRFDAPCECAVCSIIPPYIITGMERSGDERLRRIASHMREAMLRLRERRIKRFSATAVVRTLRSKPAPLERIIYDCGKSSILPGKQVLEEGGAIPADHAVKEAYEYSGVTWNFYKKLFNRSSIDNGGLALSSSVHYQEGPDGLDNAFWNGDQMIYGDGSGVVFDRFTKSIDVVAHELTHGVTQYEANLIYGNQSGALNEHFSDVFGILVRQWNAFQNDDAKQGDPKTADWIIGKDLLLPGVRGVGLRSMSNPGGAYDDPRLGGKDPQPKHMDHYWNLPNSAEGDWGGVHYNSGIPNYVFYLAALAIGKPAWEVVGQIWYTTLTERLKADADFTKCAAETISVARDHFGDDVAHKVAAAWASAGVKEVRPVAMAAAFKSSLRKPTEILGLHEAAKAAGKTVKQSAETASAAMASRAAKKVVNDRAGVKAASKK